MLVPLKFDVIVLVFDPDVGFDCAGGAGGTTLARPMVALPEGRNDLCTPFGAVKEYETPPLGFSIFGEDPLLRPGAFSKPSRPPGGSNTCGERVWGARGLTGRSESAGRHVPGSATLNSSATNCRIPLPISRRKRRVLAASLRTKCRIQCSFDAPNSVPICVHLRRSAILVFRRLIAQCQSMPKAHSESKQTPSDSETIFGKAWCVRGLNHGAWVGRVCMEEPLESSSK
jgi:hypothetical protein